MAQFLAIQVRLGKIAIEEVPTQYRQQVEEILSRGNLKQLATHKDKSAS